MKSLVVVSCTEAQRHFLLAHVEYAPLADQPGLPSHPLPFYESEGLMQPPYLTCGPVVAVGGDLRPNDDGKPPEMCY